MAPKNLLQLNRKGVIIMDNLDEKTKGALAYLLGFLSGIFFILTEKKSSFVRFHAWQSTIVFGLFFVADIILGFLPIFGFFLVNILGLTAFVLWLFLMWKAYQGEQYHLPYVGAWADQQLAKEKKNA